MSTFVTHLFMFTVLFGFLNYVSEILNHRHLKKVAIGDVYEGPDAMIQVALRRTRAKLFLNAKLSNEELAGVVVTFPRLSIVLSRSFDGVSKTCKNFTIAHELRHLESNDPIIRIFVLSFCSALNVAFALHATKELHFWPGALMGFALIVLGFRFAVLPAMRVLRDWQERSADLAAAKLIGFQAAFDALEDLKKFVALSNVSDLRKRRIEDIDARIVSLSCKAA